MIDQKQPNLPRIGCDMLHYAKMINDAKTGATYDTPVHLENVKSVGFKPNSSISTFFADDGPRVIYAQVGEEDVSIERADLLPSEYALLTGAIYNKGLVKVGNPTPPQGALLWRSQKSNGSYRYCRLLKTTFSVPEMNAKTKESSVEFQTQTVSGKNALRSFDGAGFEFIDDDDPNLETTVTPAVLATEWFKSPDFNPTVAYTPGS